MKTCPFRFGFFHLITLVMIICSITYGIISDTPLIFFTELWAEKTEPVEIVMNAYNPYNRIFFKPPNLDIPDGTRVIWTNNDSSFHTVTSGTYESGPTKGPDGFDSGLLVTGGSFTVKFNSSNTVDYYCTLHPFMTGQIVVR